jgi:HPr Serine kinase C-terminal domain
MSVTHHHYGFGLNFQSSIALPEMREGSRAGHDVIAVRMAKADCPIDLVEAATGMFAGPNDFWMEVPNVVRMHVYGGHRINFEPATGASLADVRAYLLGSGIGALLHQRQIMPLHASAVEIDGVAVAFCGASGAGKSSIALYLVKRGHRLLCDDICAIDVSSGHPQIWPGLVNLKLWRETLEASGETTDGLQPVVQSIDKYRRPVTELAQYQSHPLDHIFFLNVSTKQMPSVESLPGAAGIHDLVSNTFRGLVIKPMRQQRIHFEQCVKIGQLVRIHKLSRLWDLAALNQVGDAVLQTVTKKKLAPLGYHFPL